ncbi:hypothetical protein [Aliidiomarina quisquiliarum]|uniref:hypothetical protein n=1 Tax=Aliidiomarina quisquiliarum TaxID=2938947 RepID=UPI00208F7260|nr:hypothetical protein [Aliidiomarina quisquiliarum]MCO4322143.1 hypothetical protein [Aliidiomarina quisquiliarum]
MPYIKRSSDGQIESVSANVSDETNEFIASDSSELTKFWNSLAGKSHAELTQSDTDVARIFEDLVDILINKGVIQFTDLPKPAQAKLIKRQDLRKKVGNLDYKIDYDDDNINLG